MYLTHCWLYLLNAKVASAEHFIDEEDHAFLQLEEELKTIESSVTMLTSNVEQLVRSVVLIVYTIKKTIAF